MQPLTPGGSSNWGIGSLESARPARPGTSPLARDQVDLNASPTPALIRPDLVKSSSGPRESSPRPWPVAPSSCTALAQVGHRGQLEATAGCLFSGPASAGLVSAFPEPKEDWNHRATPDGWKVPSNPSRTPIRPRDIFEIVTGTDDLGPLQVVASSAGRIRALRLQWPEEFLEPAWSAHKAVFHDLLTRLNPDVEMHIVAEGLGGAALEKLLEQWSIPAPGRVHIHGLHLRSTPEMLYEPLTLWARDGALLTQTQEGQEVLLLPRSFRGDGLVDPRINRLVVQGTGAAPARLQSALPWLVVRRCGLYFEGGDVVASRKAVLLGQQTLVRNMTELHLSREAVIEKFQQLLGLNVVIVEPQPDFHIDLGFTFLDDQTVAVADPGMALPAASQLPDLQPLLQATRDKQLQQRYDRAARNLEEHGYRVVRLPNLGGIGLTTPYITYNNVLLESYEAIKKVYLPQYQLNPLDELARKVYLQHGFQVVEMPSAPLSTRLWGSIRCATGELRVTDSVVAHGRLAAESVAS